MERNDSGNGQYSEGEIQVIKTRIGKRLVEVKPGQSRVIFTAGARGKHERGVFLFWTAVLEKGPYKGRSKVFGRARSTLSPGDRFRRTQKEITTAETASDRKAYARIWEKLAYVKYVRPSNKTEIIEWMRTHKEDSCFVTSGVTYKGQLIYAGGRG